MVPRRNSGGDEGHKIVLLLGYFDQKRDHFYSV